MYLVTYIEIEDYHGENTEIIGMFSSYELAENAAREYQIKTYGGKWKEKWVFERGECYLSRTCLFRITPIEVDKIYDELHS